MWIFHDFPNAVVGEKEGASSKQVNSPYVGLTSLVRLNYIHVGYASTTSIKSYIYTCPLSKVHICGFLKTRHIEDVLLQVHIHFRLIWLGGTGWATRYIKIPETPGLQFIDPAVDPDLLLFAGAFGPGVGDCLRVGQILDLDLDVLFYEKVKGVGMWEGREVQRSRGSGNGF